MFYLMNIDSVTPYVYFMTADRKRQLALMFFPCWPINNDSGTPVDVFAGIRTWAVWSINLRTYQCTIKTPNKDNTMVTLDFIIRMKWRSLMFFSWRPIKNDSVTPYVFFHDDQLKTTVLPLMFFFMTTNKKRPCYPLWFFSWRPKKNNSVTPYVLFDKYRQCYPLCFFSWWPIKNNSVTPYGFFHDDQ